MREHLFRLDNRVAVITGGYRGIGRALGIALGRAGAHVVAADVLDEAVGRETLGLIEQAGGKGECVRCDVTDSKGVDETFAQSVHARSSYKCAEIVWNARFANILKLPSDGQSIAIDVAHIHEIEALEPAS